MQNIRHQLHTVMQEMSYSQREIMHKLKDLKLHLLRIPYISNIVCRCKIDINIFSENKTELVFDSYFSSCTNNVQVHDCILNSCVIAKVCVDIVLSYLPNVIMFRYCKVNSYFSTFSIQTDDIVYKFEHYPHLSKDTYYQENLFDHKYVKYMITAATPPEIFANIINNIEYTNDHVQLLNNINALYHNELVITNITTFLTIMCCILRVKEYFPKSLLEKN